MVVETGEECDCGYKTDLSCKKDTCCLGREEGSASTGCKRPVGKVCRSVSHLLVPLFCL